MIIIGLAGRKRSGKDTVGMMIRDSRPGWVVSAFASKLKEIVKDVYDFSDEQIHGALKEVPDLRYPRPDGTCLTPREAMEQLGTQWGRARYPDTWLDLGMRTAKMFMDRGNNFVFTDCRFVNEAKAIIAVGGEVWRIHREIADAVPATHQAESEMDTPEFKALVSRHFENDGTLEELREQVHFKLKGLRLLK